MMTNKDMAILQEANIQLAKANQRSGVFLALMLALLIASLVNIGVYFL